MIDYSIYNFFMLIFEFFEKKIDNEPSRTFFSNLKNRTEIAES